MVFLRPAELPYVRSVFTRCLNHASLLHMYLRARYAGGSSFHPLGSSGRAGALPLNALGHLFLLIVTTQLAIVGHTPQYRTGEDGVEGAARGCASDEGCSERRMVSR
jgi:hypothetical protein